MPEEKFFDSNTEKDIGREMEKYYADLASQWENLDEQGRQANPEHERFARLYRQYAEKAGARRFYDSVMVDGVAEHSIYGDVKKWKDLFQKELANAKGQDANTLQAEFGRDQKFLGYMNDYLDKFSEAVFASLQEPVLQPELGSEKENHDEESLARAELERAFGPEVELEAPSKPEVLEKIEEPQVGEQQIEEKLETVVQTPEPENPAESETQVTKEQETEREWRAAEINRLARSLEKEIEDKKEELKRVRVIAGALKKGKRLGKRDSNFLDKISNAA